MSLQYEEWRNRHKTILETFPDKKIMMLYTGGKDSSVILSFLIRSGKEFGFQFDTSAAVYPNHVFIRSDIEKLDSYWRTRGVYIQWHDIKTPDTLLSDAQREGKNPCYICHRVKRKYLFNLLQEMENTGKDIVIILSFNLWDLVSYAVEYLAGGVFMGNAGKSKETVDKSPEQRFMETSQRFYPLIQLKEGLTIFKPLLSYNDPEITRVITEENIPLSSMVCTYKNYTPKRILGEYYKQIDATFDYENVIKFARENLKLRDVDYYSQMGKMDFINVL